MNDYIKREAAIALITSRYECPEICAAEIKAIPAADVAPVVHGKWVHVWCCSRCGYVVTTESRDEEPRKKYCSDCGAKMDGEEENA